MEPSPIGFDVANAGADATVAPVPPPEGNIYPAVAPDASPYPPLDQGATSVNQVKPIGFEMHEVNADNRGPFEVVTDKAPLDGVKGGNENEKAESEIERLLPVKKDVNDEDNMFFNDGIRRIDYILAYEPGAYQGEREENRIHKRKYYQAQLEQEGLELEFEPAEKSKSGKVAFVKVHASWEVLAKGAEMMNMKMPIALNDMGVEINSCWDCIPTPFDLDKEVMPDDENYFTAPFNRGRLEQYHIQNKDTFFSNAQRSRIVHEILGRCFYEPEDSANPHKRRFGLKKMINNGSYQAAYPLHDGKFLSEHSLLTRGKLNNRHLLYETWARPRTWYKFQPLDQIRNYFGEKVGIYFTWLGYYTMMLIPASIVGLIAFIYGCATILDDELGLEICDKNKAGNLTMCPLCDGRCSYWFLEESCNYSRATYLFDNPATVAFACFMALWASFFHEIWKRKQAEIEYDWDVADFEQEEETVRPEFEQKVARKRENPINKKLEPYLPGWSKCVRYCSSLFVIVFFMCLVLAAVFGVIVYRIVIAVVLYASEEDIVRSRASLIASGTAACINLVVIVILNFIYQRIAHELTELESHRTQTEWEDAFTFKMFLFQFVNFYSSIIYIAFFKGRFVGRPGDYDYNLLGYRQEECDPAGCLIELCLQLGIIMVGKQIFANFKEIILPKLTVWFKSRSAEKDKEDKIYTRWEQDYNLADIPKLGLFDEYLEMVIQYGFVTIFVAAFPLAPLFALLNNIIEIRLDAYKFITQWKRPLAVRAQDIGIWFGILRGISAIAVISNAAIIAFTSEFIPRMVYKYGIRSDQSLKGYYSEFAMSYFDVNDFQEQSVPDNKKLEEFGVVTQCRYRDFREPPSAYNKYEYTMEFWYVFAAKLAFIVVFENFIVFVSWLIMYLVPDMPYAVKVQMLREKYLSKQALFHAEALKTQRGETENVRNRDEIAVNTSL